MKGVCEVLQSGCAPPTTAPNGPSQHERTADQCRIGTGVLGHVEDRLYKREKRLKRRRVRGTRREEEERAESRLGRSCGNGTAVKDATGSGKEIFAFLDDMTGRNAL
jgi:hypothetical protein